MSAQDNRELYLRWLSKAHPQVFAQAVRIATDKAGLGAIGGWVDTIVNAAVTIGGTLMAKKQADQAASLQKKQQQADLQLQLLQVNSQRAQAGQPPVDINGNLIPGATLPVLTGRPSQVTLQSASNSLPWIFGGIAALLAVVWVARGR